MYNSNTILRFTWDDNKAAINIRKHGISFKEASSVFHDPYARVIPDPDHSQDEERFVILGISDHARVLVVCHCYRENEEVIRLISARKATRKETSTYGRLYDAR
ncbi:BrnT family toxin [Bifidobacterium sp. 82T24]|uniref:BrnT family toxin n=1 Tax=Bifidobacterium pluvialisilvae TaxID=2834436 RepID=UPI001C58AFE5|nr:BrnT family toxin [Bifidobacterium pluvialisilvae]MBW3088519.1 BrnT family toxin [Bifidobacterium pluvialisilvae]